MHLVESVKQKVKLKLKSHGETEKSETEQMKLRPGKKNYI